MAILLPLILQHTMLLGLLGGQAEADYGALRVLVSNLKVSPYPREYAVDPPVVDGLRSLLHQPFLTSPQGLVDFVKGLSAPDRESYPMEPVLELLVLGHAKQRLSAVDYSRLLEAAYCTRSGVFLDARGVAVKQIWSLKAGKLATAVRSLRARGRMRFMLLRVESLVTRYADIARLNGPNR